MIVAGLDLSLTATGVAVINLTEPTASGLWTFGTKPTDQTIAKRLARFDTLADLILDQVVRANVVVVEAPALSRNMSGTFERAGLWWCVVHALHANQIPVAEVSPTALKKYATGKGNASKDQVLLAVARRYPSWPVDNNNEADALALAAMGARALNHPIEPSLPVLQTAAVSRVHWPFALEVPF